MRKAALTSSVISVVLVSVYLYSWEAVTQPQSIKLPSPLSQHQWDQIHSGTNHSCPTQTLTPHPTPVNDTHLSPEEWQALREALRWPSPDRPVTSLDNTTDPRHCFYYVENLRDNYTVGDTLNITLVARDFSGNPKIYGGDFFQARLHSPELKASTYGSVQDHRNGTYTVHFSLLWPGQAWISLRLIHSSEAVQVLLRHREADPNKVSFRGYFEEGGRSETVVCNAQRSGSRCCCEYKDPATGEMWFCQKPAALPCHALVYHSAGTYQAKLTDLDKSLLDTKLTNVDVGIPGTDPKIHILPLDTESRQEQKCAPGLDTPVPAGFYFQDRWTSLVCSARSFSSAEQIVGCLKDKQLYMMGDSTLRQWFEYLQTTVPSKSPRHQHTRYATLTLPTLLLRKTVKSSLPPALELMNLHTSGQSGPLLAVDTGNNVILRWRAHGLPIRTLKVPRARLHYIANEIDGLAGDAYTVVGFNLWAHFTTFPLATFVRRVAIIREAVRSLLRRSPQTLVVIKSANTGYKDVYGSDWLSLQLDTVLRRMFQGLPVAFIDVWQMTSCHYTPDQIHPQPVVIRNEVDLFLSFVCPQ
ncbi:NXPE family member 3 [Amia ocellicauda]|uniref:NXPE family member 3 n=1 Tax=Amia ocellicauda TaxID=2972642 RepID=UPI003464C9CC